MSIFWSLYVTVLTLGTIFALTWLLLSTRKGQRDEATEETVGHSFDGIEEYDNPLPKWWVYLFVITVLFSLAYGVLYPTFGKYQGLLGWSSQGQHQAEVAALLAGAICGLQSPSPIHASLAASKAPLPSVSA